MGAGRTSSATWFFSGPSGRRSKIRWAEGDTLRSISWEDWQPRWRRSPPLPTPQFLTSWRAEPSPPMGAFLVTYPRDRIKTVLLIFIFVKITLIPAALLIGFWFLTQLIHAGQVAHVQTGGVAYLAHVGGFIFGAVTARWFEGRPIVFQEAD